ncbi:uroporphyrinogen-III C-methyltransferase [Rhodococcus sp. X156]|uniref:uroporphyrinogen-III C-methyltransferase n=1 Tax=Rhodococcus sp. X156 TaxID=2499145 RepID=UPI000FD78503|nr:uroporphyrinogen-III C-methyltransferase [Rhodococcus sp. X156]
MAEPAGTYYLAGLDLRGRRVVVVGAGTVAQRRLVRLLAVNADVVVVAPAATPTVQAMADTGQLRWERRSFQGSDLDDAWYVLACTDEPAVNAAVVAESERRRVFCVRADDAARGSAVTPATTEHDGLMVGVLSGGHPRRSSAAVSAIRRALQRGMLTETAPERPVGVALVGSGPGDPELLTVRGRRLLGQADVVVTDRLGATDLLQELGADVEVIDAAKVPYGRAMAQEDINAVLIDRARAGKFVVRLKGGDPYLFGRGYEELLACTEAGVPVTVVPGLTSAFAVPAAAGVPVTHRGVAHEVVVVSGHVAPDDPRSLVDWPALGRLSGTLVLLMAVKRLAQFAEVLMAHGRAGDTPVRIIQEGTTRTERVVCTSLAHAATDARAHDIRPPAIIVIGAVAGLGGGGDV